jgi:putative addiction module killer protein
MDLLPKFMQHEVRVTTEFSDWLNGLKDGLAREAIVKRLARVQIGNFGDHKTEGDGISALRVHHGPGYRAYYTVRGRVVVFMLIGGTKRTQDKDIARARQMAKEI